MLRIFIYIFLHTSYNLLRHRIHLCNKSHAHVSELFALFDIRPTEHAVFRVPSMGWRVARSIIQLRNSFPPSPRVSDLRDRKPHFESIRAPIWYFCTPKCVWIKTEALRFPENRCTRSYYYMT